jgi:hypothetical protein
MSVRALLAGGVLICIIAGAFYLVRFQNRARCQAEAVALIRSRGGVVFYDYQSNGAHEVDLSLKPVWPLWAIDVLGIDFFASVVGVELDRAQITEADDKKLEQLGFNLADVEMKRLGTN